MAILKVWDGTQWVTPGAYKIWNGSAWITPVVKVWDGTQWVTASATVTVSGEVITDQTTQSRQHAAGIRVNSDGTIDKLVNTTYTPIDTATDWIIPNSVAPDDYECRFEKDSGTGTVSGDTLDTWHPLTSNREFKLVRATDANEQQVVGTLRIRKGTGAEIDSASYTFNAGKIGV